MEMSFSCTCLQPLTKNDMIMLLFNEGICQEHRGSHVRWWQWFMCWRMLLTLRQLHPGRWLIHKLLQLWVDLCYDSLLLLLLLPLSVFVGHHIFPKVTPGGAGCPFRSSKENLWGLMVRVLIYQMHFLSPNKIVKELQEYTDTINEIWWEIYLYYIYKFGNQAIGIQKSLGKTLQNPLPVPSPDKLGGLWQEGYPA